MAVHQDRAGGVQPVDVVEQVRQGRQRGTGDSNNRPLLGLSTVDQLRGVGRGEEEPSLLHGDLDHGLGAQVKHAAVPEPLERVAVFVSRLLIAEAP